MLVAERAIRRGVDARLASLGQSQVATVAARGAQLADAHGMHATGLLGVWVDLGLHFARMAKLRLNAALLSADSR